MYTSNLYTTCPATQYVNYDQRGHLTYEASNTINTYQVTMSGGVTTDVKLRAGNKIVFSPGANLKNGTLRATIIGPCGVPYPSAPVIISNKIIYSEPINGGVPDTKNKNIPRNTSNKKRIDILLPKKDLNIRQDRKIINNNQEKSEDQPR